MCESLLNICVFSKHQLTVMWSWSNGRSQASSLWSDTVVLIEAHWSWGFYIRIYSTCM